MKRFDCILFGLFFLLHLAGSCLAETNCSKASKQLSLASVLGSNDPESIKKINEAISLCPESAAPKYALGVFLFENKQYKQALEVFKVVADRYDGPLGPLGLARTYYELGELAQSKEFYRTALDRDPKNPLVMHGLASLHILDKDFGEAQRLLRLALRYRGRDGALCYNLGLVLERLGRFDDAISSQQCAAQYLAQSWEPQVALTRLYLSKSDLVSALQHAEKGAQVAPQEPRVWISLARTREAKQQHQEAKTSIEKALALNSKDNEALELLAMVHIRLGEFEQGTKIYRDLIVQNPDDSSLNGALGWAYLSTGELEQAQESLEKAIELDANNAFALNNLGVLFERTDRLNKAKEMFERSLAVDSKLGAAKSNLKLLENN